MAVCHRQIDGNQVRTATISVEISWRFFFISVFGEAVLQADDAVEGVIVLGILAEVADAD